MIIVMKAESSKEQTIDVMSRIESLGLRAVKSNGSERIVIGAIGDERLIPEGFFAKFTAVEQVLPILKPYKLVSREFNPENTVITVKGIPIGGQAFQVIAGPCSVETQAQMRESAEGVFAAGALFMRGGAFKPRTSPYSFQGLGELGLKYLVESAKKHDLPVVTELMDPRDIDTVLDHGVDIIQIGTRNMQNFRLLKEVGKLNVPVILKRGMSATIKEWLMAAEYIAANGNMNIILAERGIRTFEDAYRNVLDVTAIPFLKRETHLPVIVDPSHAGGQAWMVPALSRAAIAAGADGLLVESHPNPSQAWSDGEQALTTEELIMLMEELGAIGDAIGRPLGRMVKDPVNPFESTMRQAG